MILSSSILQMPKELEVVLIVSDRCCLENAINIMKSRQVESEIFWVKDSEKAINFVLSTGAYLGKKMTSNPKLFLAEARFGVDSCKQVLKTIKGKRGLENSSFFVLADTMEEGKKDQFRNAGMEILDEDVIIEPKKPRPIYDWC